MEVPQRRADEVEAVRRFKRRLEPLARVLTAAEYRAYETLFVDAGCQEGSVEMSFPALAAVFGVDPRAARKWVDRLEALGLLLQVTKRAGPRMWYLYPPEQLDRPRRVEHDGQGELFEPEHPPSTADPPTIQLHREEQPRRPNLPATPKSTSDFCARKSPTPIVQKTPNQHSRQVAQPGTEAGVRSEERAGESDFCERKGPTAPMLPIEKKRSALPLTIEQPGSIGEVPNRSPSSKAREERDQRSDTEAQSMHVGRALVRMFDAQAKQTHPLQRMASIVQEIVNTVRDANMSVIVARRAAEAVVLHGLPMSVLRELLDTIAGKHAKQAKKRPGEEPEFRNSSGAFFSAGMRLRCEKHRVKWPFGKKETR